MKEKTNNCKNVLQQRYEGLKADSIGGVGRRAAWGTEKLELRWWSIFWACSHLLRVLGTMVLDGLGAEQQAVVRECSRMRVWHSPVGLSPHPAPTSFNLVSSCCPDAASVRGRQLLAGLEKVNSDLDKQEKAITANLRPPLEQSRAVQDSTERSKDLKVGLWG